MPVIVLTDFVSDYVVRTPCSTVF